MGVATVLPDHLRIDSRTKEPLPDARVIANCLLVVNQALRWGVDPFALAAESYVVGGKLAYQGKLVAAIVNTRAGLLGRLSATYNDKTGDALEITVSGQFPDEAEPRTIKLSVGEAKTSNDMWRKDPRQKLWYSAAIKWARRHCPEVLLGVLTEDDAERIEQTHYVQSVDVTASKSERIAARIPEKKEPEPEAETTQEQPAETSADAESQESLINILLRNVKSSTKLGDVNFIEGRAVDLNEEDKATLIRACLERRDQIKAARGKLIETT